MFSFYRKKWKTRGSLAASRAMKKPWNSIGLSDPGHLCAPSGIERRQQSVSGMYTS
jgi:hypothetical protein